METGTLEKKIAKLPENLKQRVEGYVDALLVEEVEKNIAGESFVNYKPMRTPKPIFGSGKGTFGKMSDDFDEPLDEMKDYM
jgi:hypothetical protein